MPYNGEFHFTALRTLGTFRTMSASRRFPRSCFQPGIPAMYACTGASPSAFAIWGLPPVRSFSGLALALAFALAFALALAFGPSLLADRLEAMAIGQPLLRVISCELLP